ncbi:Uma2 family endonuclease [Azospirillum sp. SYSU D00513]|uniref:Uma2 family endonuclease n=1 Tax=Azospirillum sp. SYSU D00513 TaxID=2812561 RepID=UPI001A977DBE|nr:Uma2 family endonuclease [Azospirillum sp. SYSU D00513]
MGNAARQVPPPLTVEKFLATDPSEFGPAWRYELVDGQPVAQAAPTPEHGAILANLAAALKTRLRGTPCRPEGGSAAVPRDKSRDRARIPDVLVRCDGLPTVLFEIVSPSDGKSQVEKANRYRDLKNVEGVREIVEVVQDEYLCRLHRWRNEIAGWQMVEIDGPDGVLPLASLGIEIAFAEIYDGVLEPVPSERRDAG